MLSKSIRVIAKSLAAILLLFTAVACSSETKQSSSNPETAAPVKQAAAGTNNPQSVTASVTKTAATSAPINLVASPVAATASNKLPVTTVFECVQTDTGFATFVKRGERQLSVPLLTWNKEEFGPDFTPEKRCKMVSQKLTDKVASNGGRLQGLSLAYGKVNDFTVICALTLKENKCNSENQLFTLSEANAKKPGLALSKIFKFSQGNATGDDTIPENGFWRIALENLAPDTPSPDNPPLSKPINPLPNKASDVKTNDVPEDKGF
jgi:hypothetical protein